MKTLGLDRIILTLSACLALAAVGCGGGGDTPPGTDGGGHDAGHATADTGVDSGAAPTDAGADTGTTDVDAGSDAGPCTSTMPHCDTCVTAATDPYNACSSFVTGCIPFDNTRVPGWPDHIPAVTP